MVRPDKQSALVRSIKGCIKTSRARLLQEGIKEYKRSYAVKNTSNRTEEWNGQTLSNCRKGKQSL